MSLELGLSTETADSSLVQPSTSEAVVQDSWTPSLISPEEILRPPLRASLRCPRSPRGWRWGTPCPPPGHPSSTLNLLMTQDRLGPSHPLARGPTQFYFTNYQRGRGQFWGVSGGPSPVLEGASVFTPSQWEHRPQRRDLSTCCTAGKSPVGLRGLC